jgi:hypothetical protein
MENESRISHVYEYIIMTFEENIQRNRRRRNNSTKSSENIIGKFQSP